MGKRTIEIRFCDNCGKEIIGRLTVHTCPCCGKDICVECQEKEDARHKPRERKAKTEPVRETPVFPPEAEDKDGVLIEQVPDLISTFRIQTLYPDGKDGQPSRLSMGEFAVVKLALKAGARELMGLAGVTREDVEEAPESDGKRLLMEIIK